MSTFTNKKLITPTVIPITATLVYTVPASKTTILTVITVCNTTATALSFTINLCNQNDVASAANAILQDATIDPKTTVNFNFGQVLSAGDKVRASSSALGITLHMSGIEISG